MEVCLRKGPMTRQLVLLIPGYLEDLNAVRGETLAQEPGLLEQLRKCCEVAESTRGKRRLQ